MTGLREAARLLVRAWDMSPCQTCGGTGVAWDWPDATALRAALAAVPSESDPTGQATTLYSLLQNYGDHHEWCNERAAGEHWCACGFLTYIVQFDPARRPLAVPSESDAGLREALGTKRGYPVVSDDKETGYDVGWEPDPIGAYVQWDDVARVLAAPPSGNLTGLGAAWAEAEAVLPEGWWLYLAKTAKGRYGAQVRGGRRTGASGDTPAAALRALATKLREDRP